MRTHTHTHTHTHKYTEKRGITHAHIHITHMHTRMHEYTQVHIHTHSLLNTQPHTYNIITKKIKIEKGARKGEYSCTKEKMGAWWSWVA